MHNNNNNNSNSNNNNNNYAPSNGASKPDIIEIDHEQKPIILYEGTVCVVGKRHQKWSEKQNKYPECRAGLLNLYEGYTVKQGNIVFHFIGGYSKNLFKNLLETIPKKFMKIKKLIDNMQRAVLFGNYNIIRKFKAFKRTFYLFLNTDFHKLNILLFHSLIYSAKVISSTVMYLLFKTIPLMIIILIVHV